MRGYESAAAENDEHRSRVSAKPGQEWSARCVLGVWVSVFCRERHRRSFEVVICGWRACVCCPVGDVEPNYFFLIPMGGVDPKRGD